MTTINLPRQYLFQLDTPLIIFNNRLIQPKSLTTEENNNYIQFYSNIFSLEEIITPKKLENLYFKHYASEIQNLEQDVMRSYFNKDYLSKQKILSDINQNKVLNLLVKKVLPIITAEKMENEIDDILSEDNSHSHSNRSTSNSTNNSVNIEELPESLRREIDSIKNDLILKINNEYNKYKLNPEKIISNSNKNDYVDNQISNIFSNILNPSQDNYNDSELIKFPILNEDSSLKDYISDNKFMIINGNTYSLLPIKEIISFFKKSIKPDFYRQTQNFGLNLNPVEIVRILENNKQHIDHKYFSRIVNKIKTSKLRINGQYYIPLFWDKTSEFAKIYDKFMEKKIKIDAVDHNAYQTRVLHTLAKEKAKLESIINQRDYVKNNAGFKKIQGGYTVFVKTPAYALKSPHLRADNCYVPFAPASIGVNVSVVNSSSYGYNYNTSEGSTFQVQGPFIMHSYKHPFLGDASEGKSICLGEWSDNNQSRLNSMSAEQKILTLLEQGKKTLLMGYRTGGNPYIPLQRARWSNWLTLEEVERRGLLVLNDFSRR